MVPERDRELVQIVDAALADATARARRADGGSWLACRPGCTPCCHGVFRMSALDGERLRAGLAAADPVQAEAVRGRARALVERIGAAFPGDAATGVLWEEDERWELFADLPESDAACPVLEPETGRCALYASRPLTCRIFGPPVENEFGLGVCELCYVGATEEQMLLGEMRMEHVALEEEMDAGMGGGETVIAWAVLRG